MMRWSQEQGYACGYATCTLEGNGLPPFSLHPKPGAVRLRWLA